MDTIRAANRGSDFMVKSSKVLVPAKKTDAHDLQSSERYGFNLILFLMVFRKAKRAFFHKIAQIR
jgi:hypothetical protein